MAGAAASAANLGFLTVIEHDLHGLFGGYLLLNSAGRPLEFHCTAPVKPSRAQQILYGPTLGPYLYGEVIGATLVQKSHQPALAILVDRPALLAVRQQIELPVAMVGAPDASPTIGAIEITVGQNRLLVQAHRAADRDLIVARLSTIEELFDLNEPFGRIREAIEEAGRAQVKAA